MDRDEELAASEHILTRPGAELAGRDAAPAVGPGQFAGGVEGDESGSFRQQLEGAGFRNVSAHTLPTPETVLLAQK